MTKLIVTYDANHGVSIHWSRVNRYWWAELMALNHPRLGHGIVNTSDVVSFDPVLGRIETLNTVYVSSEEMS